MKQKNISIFFLMVLALSMLSACATAAPTTAPSSLEVAVPTSTNVTTTVASEDDGGPAGGMMMGAGAIDKSGDTVLQAMISEVQGKFQQFEYSDSETGKTLPYNLYVPADYDSSKSYPLVLFIADSSVVGKDLTAPLTQGYGGIIWATEAEQAKHESFVLVPEYPEVIIDDHGSFTTTDYVELTARMLNSVTESYSVDTNRLYGTGQSMGCMTILYLSAKYPDLFAAELFVSGQWDVSTLGNLANQKFFYIAAEGDDKASAGQAEVVNMLNNAGAKYSTAIWDATWSPDEFTTAVASILSEGNSINIATFKIGTVLPAGVSVGTSEHMYSFDYAYKVEGVRDWLFAQVKTAN
ncbi:MAG: hypothetical protein AB1649_10215 [Chloroflexota bacterium]